MTFVLKKNSWIKLVLTLILLVISMGVFGFSGLGCNILINVNTKINKNINISFNTTCKADCYYNYTLHNASSYVAGENISYNLIAENSTEFSFPFTVQDGVYDVWLLCNYSKYINSSNQTQDIERFRFTITKDSTKPNVSVDISFIEKTKIFVLDYHEEKKPVSIAFTTNEHSICMFNNTILSDDGYNHNLELNLGEGSYNYEITCQDDFGNLAKFNISFKVLKKPYAEIIFHDNQPFSQGMHEFVLKTSRALKQPPELEFTYDNKNFYYVPLTGSEDEWRGYLIISDSNTVRVGSFKIRMVDVYGIEGDLITKNNIFIEDTKEPEKITDLEVKSTSQGVLLRWYYPYDDWAYFKIYKSKSPVPNKLECIGNTTKFYYIDTNISYNESYYYVVTAVDAAGNEGEYSRAYNATKIKTESQIVSEHLQREIDELYNQIVQMKNLVDVYILKYNKLRSDYVFDFVLTKMGYFSELIDLIDSLNKLRDNVDELRYSNNVSYITSNLDQSKQELNELKHTLLINIKRVDNYSNSFMLSQEELAPIAKEYLNTWRLADDKELQRLLNVVLLLNTLYSVKRNCYVILLEFYDNSTQLVGYVQDTLKLDNFWNTSFLDYIVNSKSILSNFYSSTCVFKKYVRCKVLSPMTDLVYGFVTDKIHAKDLFYDLNSFIVPDYNVFHTHTDVVTFLTNEELAKKQISQEINASLKNISSNTTTNMPSQFENPKGNYKKKAKLQKENRFNKIVNPYGHIHDIFLKRISGYFVFNSKEESVMILVSAIVVVFLLAYYLYLTIMPAKNLGMKRSHSKSTHIKGKSIKQKTHSKAFEFSNDKKDNVGSLGLYKKISLPSLKPGKDEPDIDNLPEEIILANKFLDEISKENKENSSQGSRNDSI